MRLRSRGERIHTRMHKTLLIIGSEKVNQSRRLTIKQGYQKVDSTEPGGEGTPIHYLYRYVPPNGVVILKLLI